jgi:ArsR family metal-binding transcriptional regulator
MMRAKEVIVFLPPCDLNSQVVSANAYVDEDLSELLPYLNATQEAAKYYPNGPFIKFNWQRHPVTVEPGRVAVGGFEDNDSAREAVEKVIDVINEVASRKENIGPDHTPYNPPSVMEIFKLLPKRAGCKRCGYETCMAFAAAVSEGGAEIDSCPVLCEEEEFQEARDKLRELVS